MPQSAENPGIGILSQEDLRDLGIDGIQDPAVKKEVEDFLKSRPKLLDDIKTGSKQARDFLSEKVKEINASKQKANELIKSIVKTLLQKIPEKTAAFSKELQDYYANASKEIEAMAATNAAGASDAAQKLLAETATITGMMGLNAMVRAKMTAVTDPEIKKNYGALSDKIDSNLKAAPAEKDPQKRAGLLDLNALEAEKNKLDSSAAPVSQAPAAATEAAAGTAQTAPAAAEQQPPAEEPEPEFSITNIGPWLKYQVKSFKKSLTDAMSFFKGIPAAIGGVLGIFGVKSAMSKPQSSPGTIPEDPQLRDARKLLSEKFSLKDEEFGKLKDMRLKEFLELRESPAWLDKNRFEKLKKGLAFNRNDNGDAEIPVWKFISQKLSDWKDAPEEASSSAG